MRAYVTLAQTLLITSLVNSAFAVPAPAPQVHDKRLYSSGPSGAIIGETGEATTGGYGQVVKENALAGILSGLAAAIASVGQLKLYAHIKNSTCVSFPFLTLPSPNVLGHPGDKPSDLLF
jgi:hypothetical protein